MKLKLRAAAVVDLDTIYDYTFAAHGDEMADAYLLSLDHVMERLREHPELGAARDLRPGLRSISGGEHRIFYRVERATIVIVRVLHKAMDADRRL